MSEGEVFMLFASIGASLFLWWRWIALLRGQSTESRGPFVFVAALSSVFAILVTILVSLASHDVRDSIPYILFYTVMGYAVVSVGLLALKLVGLQAWDIAERRNVAAALVFLGLTIANTFAFAGANIGDGPGFYVVALCAMLSNGFLFLSVIAHAVLTRSVYRVLVDRDSAIALRLSSAWISIGIIAGRAVAGSWTSMPDAIEDFVFMGWPALILMCFDIVVGQLTGRSASTSRTLQLFFAALYVIGTIVFVAVLGVPQ